jgi:hypothetical protein
VHAFDVPPRDNAVVSGTADGSMLDTLELRPQPWANGEDLDDEVRIVIDGTDLIHLVTVAEDALTPRAGPSIADSYAGLRPAEVLWPSHHLLGAPQAMWKVCGVKTALLRCRLCDNEIRWPVLAKIEISDHDVVWRDFEQRRCVDPDVPGSTEERHDYPTLGPFRFSRLQYEAQVRQVSTMAVFHAVEPGELQLIEESGWRRFAPAASHDPVTTLALTWGHARRLAADGTRHRSVIRCNVATSFLTRYRVVASGGSGAQEYQVPAADLDALNVALVGPIEVADGPGGA